MHILFFIFKKALFEMWNTQPLVSDTASGWIAEIVPIRLIGDKKLLEAFIR